MILCTPYATAEPRRLTLGSLFTGIGGIDLAFQRAGFNIAFQVEIDDYCNKVLERHWPNVTRHRDVRTVGSRNLPTVDVLAGGFPCQDISAAGKGAGIKEGTRSGLWFEFARIIGEIRPRIVMLENVAAITSRDGTRVIADLTALGYDAEWGIISAADAGASHRRERWWCVAYASSVRGGSRWAERERQPRSSAFISDSTMADSSSPGAGMEEPDPVGSGWQSADSRQSALLRQSDRAVIAEGLVPGSRNVADTKSTGQCQPRHDGSNVREAGQSDSSNRQEWSGSGIGSEVRDQSKLAAPLNGGCEGRQPIGDRPIALMPSSSASTRRQFEPILGRAANGLSRRLDGARWPARPGQPQHAWEAPRTTTGTTNRAARLKALGNAVVPQVVQPIAEAIRTVLETKDTEAGRSTNSEDA